jgi:lambda family phage portal protein
MSTILKALAWVAPKAALARAHAIDVIGRAYDGARPGRRGASFGNKGGSANTAIGPSLSRLRDRSRELARNTWIGQRILDVLVSHVVGTGIMAVPDNGSDRLDRQVSNLWEEWSDQADITGETDFPGLQALALRSMLEGGEAVLRFIPRRIGDGRVVPLALQGLEGDHIDTAREGTVEGHRTRLGVGLGDWDERTGYWLFRDHPGEMTLPSSSTQSVFTPRTDVIHLYRSLRFGQVRGVPVFAPILQSSRDIADLMDAIVVKSRTEASFAAFVKSNGGQRTLGNQVQQAGRTRIEELRPGSVNYLDQDEDIIFSNPSGTGQFEPAMLMALMAAAAGAGITYDQLTGDLRQANYSSLRAGKIEFRRLVEQLQWLGLVPKLLKPTTGRFTDTAVMAGKLRERREGYRWNYVMPAVEPIDPKKDLEADIMAVRAGRLSPQEFIAAWGRDWRKVVADMATFLEELDRQKLVLDIDPRRTTQTGAAQANPAELPPPAE